MGEKLLCFCCEFVLAQSFSTLRGVTSLPQAKLWVKNYYVSFVNLYWLNHLVLSCTGLLSPNGDNKAYLFITIYTMSLENVEFFVLIIFNTYKMIF